MFVLSSLNSNDTNPVSPIMFILDFIDSHSGSIALRDDEFSLGMGINSSFSSFTL